MGPLKFRIGGALLTAKPKHRLRRAVFTPKHVFWPSYCQISTDLVKILHTPITEYTRGPI